MPHGQAANSTATPDQARGIAKTWVARTSTMSGCTTSFRTASATGSCQPHPAVTVQRDAHRDKEHGTAALARIRRSATAAREAPPREAAGRRDRRRSPDHRVQKRGAWRSRRAGPASFDEQRAERP